jgi:membrane protein DedA with SNARE-associated domain
MNNTIDFLLRHGYAILFVFVLAEQVGLPVPALPVLLAVGALSASGQFAFPPALAVAVVAAIAADLVWYELGRRRGHAVVNLMCRVSLEPDTCVRRTEDTFARYGLRTLLFAKFIPGLNTVAPPLAGMVQTPMWRFLLYDAAGSTIWAGAFIGLGYLFSTQLERVAAYAMRLGGGLVLLLTAGLACYIGWKYVQRKRLFSRLRMSRIAPEELKRQMDAGDAPMIVDLRHFIDLDVDGFRIPGALHMKPEELERRHGEIPRGREIVLYCT